MNTNLRQLLQLLLNVLLYTAACPPSPYQWTAPASGPAGATLVLPVDADEPPPGTEKLTVGAAAQTQILWFPDAPGVLAAIPTRAAA